MASLISSKFAFTALFSARRALLWSAVGLLIHCAEGANAQDAHSLIIASRPSSEPLWEASNVPVILSVLKTDVAAKRGRSLALSAMMAGMSEALWETPKIFALSQPKPVESPSLADSAEVERNVVFSPEIESVSPASEASPTLAASKDSALGVMREEILAWRTQALSDRNQVKERAEVAAFYAARDDQPAFVINGVWTPAAHELVVQLKRATDDGIDLSAYPVPDLALVEPKSMAQRDVLLATAVAAYARQASAGRVEPQKISHLITLKPEAIPAMQALNAVIDAGAGAGATLVAFNPPDEQYRALRQKLAELRRSAPAARLRIPSGPPLKLGMTDSRVPLIRNHFGLAPDMDQSADNAVYDTRVATAVAGFQRENGLPASGVLTPRTVAALTGGEPSRLEGSILTAMEIRRWEPRRHDPDRVEVNVPSYKLVVYRKDQPIHQARVVVGKTTSPTPIFSETMRFVIVNPYWNVPQSIIAKEMAPKLAADPEYFSRLGYEVQERHGKLIVRQPPGERNALGRIKFMFPNEHSVYLHDTPSRGLFATSRRAYSHGCVRVDRPFKLAEAVLGADRGWSEARVKSLIGSKERTLDLAQPLPIHLNYSTLVVGEDGRLLIYEDIYGYAAKVRKALGV